MPKLEPKAKKQLYQQSIKHTCCSIIELAALWNKPLPELLLRIKTKNICEQYKNDKGAKIILAPHHGSWEMLNLWLANEDELYSLYKPARKQNLDEYIQNSRSRNGAHLVPTSTTGLRQLLKALKNNANVMILPDQVPANKTAQIHANFFGHSAKTTLLIKNLTKRVDCSIYMAAMTRNLKQGTFQLSLKSLDINKINDVDEASALYLNQSIETFIQEHIEQYQWSYRRFHKNSYKF